MTFKHSAEPQHGDTSLCAECGKAITFYEYTQWNGTEYDVLDTWWSHLTHPEDDHDARI